MGASNTLWIPVFCLWLTGAVNSKNASTTMKPFSSRVRSTSLTSIISSNASTMYAKNVTESADPEGKHSGSVGNMIRGLLVFVFPPVALLIYKCCLLQST